MLEEITLRNIGGMESAHLPFAPGLNVCTGESGAGKTMILNALHLLMGRRSDTSYVRHGAAEAMAEGVWQLANEPLIAQLEETGATIEDGQLFINRTVKADGKSRAVVGGRSTPAKVLQELATQLVSIHGQADQHHLKAPEAQLASVDRYGRKAILGKAKAYHEAYRSWKQALKELTAWEASRAENEREFKRLSQLVEKLEQLDPQPGELATLAQEISLLSNLDAIKEGLTATLALLLPEDDDAVSVAGVLTAVSSRLLKLSKLDPTLGSELNLLNDAMDALDDLGKRLELHQQSLDGDSLERLYQAQEREADLRSFFRHVDFEPEQVGEVWNQAVERMKIIDPEAMNLEKLQAVVGKARLTLDAKAQALTEARVKAATLLSKAVNLELAGLAMGGNELIVRHQAVAPTPSGCDTMQFLLANPGAREPQPIATAASGGELSRIMLALEVVLADPEETPTFIFDEVDAGVGGTTAIEIGKRLAMLSKTAQVIVVTHLPQVAAFGDNHLKVAKDSVRGSVTTTVTQLTEEERVEELTRMLSGLTESTSGQAHAEELLAMARTYN